MILITGCARSGTSLIAGCINKCGAYGGEMSGANHNNKKGMFENVAIRNNIVKPYLRASGYDPKGQFPLPDPETLIRPIEWRIKINEILKHDGPVMYKGAKMCLMWPIWSFAYPNAKWIIVRRPTEQIVSSCMRTGFMSAFTSQSKLKAVGAKTPEEGWRWWVNQHLKRFEEMHEAGLDIYEVWSDKIVAGDPTELRAAIEWAGLKWNDDAIREFIDPELYHG